MQMRKAFKSFPVLITVILQHEGNTNSICGFLIVPSRGSKFVRDSSKASGTGCAWCVLGEKHRAAGGGIAEAGRGGGLWGAWWLGLRWTGPGLAAAGCAVTCLCQSPVPAFTCGHTQAGVQSPLRMGVWSCRRVWEVRVGLPMGEENLLILWCLPEESFGQAVGSQRIVLPQYRLRRYKVAAEDVVWKPKGRCWCLTDRSEAP